MRVAKLIKPGIVACCIGLLCFAIAASAESPAGDKTPQDDKSVSESGSKMEDLRVDRGIARDRAKQMHEIYLVTLDVIHHRYFHKDRAIIPARAMEDIFSEMKQRSRVEAHWISVNTKAMSIDHDPNTEFEKRAAKELGEGKTEVEVVEDGYYRRAGAIPLHGGCLRCHEGLFQTPSKKARYAGLVISIPLDVDSPKNE
jgi:hypothetical protein